MENKFEKLINDLISFSDDNMNRIKGEPKTETERGFKLATTVMCSNLKKIIYKYKLDGIDKKSYTVDEFMSLLNQIDNSEE